MNWQLPRITQSVRISLRNNLKCHANSFDSAGIPNSGVWSHADKGLGASTINFTAGGVDVTLSRPIREDRRKPFVSRILGKSFRWQFGRRVIGLHRNNITAGFGKGGRKMSTRTSLLKCVPKIDGAIRTDGFKHDYPLCIGFPTAAGIAVADQYSDWHTNSRRSLEGPRLQPEIMGRGRSGDEDQRELGKGKAHGRESPFDFICSFYRRVDAYSLSIPNWHHLRNAAAALFLTGVSATYSVPAYAHEQADAAGGVASGFSHPFLGADHMLAMVAVGIWGAFLGKPLLVILPMVFPVMMTVGAAIAMAGVSFPPVELGIAFSVIALGLLILWAARIPPVFACLVVAMFGLFHGYAHGTELPSTADPVGYSVGFVLATGLLHLAGIGLGLLKSMRFGEVGLRAAGAIIAATGLTFLVGGLPL